MLHATIDLLMDEQYGDCYCAWLDADLPLADIFSRLRDERFADELHPNAEGARIIAKEVFKVLVSLHSPQR